MKVVNLHKVLHTILLHYPISRAKISKILDINKVTVSQCIDYFLEKGIVCEIGTTGTSRGRPATLLDINRKSGVFVGINTELHESSILVTDLTGKELSREALPILGPDPMKFLNFFSSKVAELKQKYHDYSLGIIGIGMALPGHYNYKTGMIEHIANLQSWNGFPIRDEINKLNLGCKIYTMNLANAGAIGELKFGKASNSKDLVYINGTWGLGVGVITDGKILLGNTGFAGRLGHSLIHFNGKKCTCGKRGCWEAYASIRTLYGNLYPNQHYDQGNLNTIFEKFNKNDAKVINAVHELGHYLSLGLINVINAYNPKDICIGGNLSLLGSPLINQLKITLEDYIQKHLYEGLNIYCSELASLSAAYGAISTVRDNLLEILMES